MKQPVRKLRSLRMCRSTRPLGWVQECQTQPMKRDDQRGDGPAHPDGAEPVVFLALVEDDLQAAGPDDQQAEADVVEGADLGVLDVGRIVDEAADHDDGENADGDVDVEGVAPAEGVGEPAAQGGAEHRRDHDAQAVGGHGLGALSERKAFEQDGLRKRLQRAAAGALHDARQQNDAQRGRRAAEERRDGEDDDAGEQEALAAEAAGEPVGGGQDDGVGDQVAGEHPGGLGVGGGERAGDVGQRHRGDGGVQHLHEGGQHDRDGDQPGVDALGERVAGLGGVRCHGEGTIEGKPMGRQRPVTTAMGARSENRRRFDNYPDWLDTTGHPLMLNSSGFVQFSAPRRVPGFAGSRLLSRQML